jgi:hypothetical protein
MIEPNTLVLWAHELAEFVNGYAEPHPLFTEEDIEDNEAYQLPQEPRTLKQLAALRERATRCLKALAKTKRSKVIDEKLVRLADAWLAHPLVRSTHAAYNFTPMDAVLSLSASGRLQVVPRFRSFDAQCATTFAELIQPAPKGKKEKGPPLIKQCCIKTCREFFVLVPSRRRPWSHCPRHRQEIKQTHRKPKPRNHS